MGGDVGVISFLKKRVSLAGDAFLAMIYWTRSAEQKNVDSLVKLGDYYLHGLGTSPDEEKAAACYQAAGGAYACVAADADGRPERAYDHPSGGLVWNWVAVYGDEEQADG